VKSVQSWPAVSPSAIFCKFFTQTWVRTEVIFSLVYCLFTFAEMLQTQENVIGKIGKQNKMSEIFSKRTKLKKSKVSEINPD
jgi:hypothetical protein